MDTKEAIISAVEQAISRHNMEIVDLVVGKHRNKTFLQFFLDKNEGGITIDDCQKMSDIISGILDMEEIVKGAYVLEVSSPGINRPLTKPEHFKKFTGQPAKIELIADVGGQHNFTGTIFEATDDGFTLDEGTKKHEFKYSEVKKARLDPVIEF